MPVLSVIELKFLTFPVYGLVLILTEVLAALSFKMMDL